MGGVQPENLSFFLSASPSFYLTLLWQKAESRRACVCVCVCVRLWQKEIKKNIEKERKETI